MKRNLISEIKVAQLAGYVSEKTAYHHGEQSLIGSIVNMAQTFVGSNNLNLLEPCGQFGTRLMGGKDAASARYIFTRLSSNARLICDPRDDAILNYLEDDGQQIEPEFYVPTLPLILVNGADGIGTGFSTNIPTFNPKDIKKNIALAIKGKPLVSMTPWVNGFTGTVTKKNESCWTFSGIYDNGIVSELPPGKWTQDYRETLDKLQVQGVIRSYENHSTEEKPNFIIKGYTKDSPLKDLKLTRDVRTSNMYLMTEQGIKKYNNAEEIVYEFVCNRKLWYDARKKHMILTLSKEVEYLTTKTRFVRDVVNKNIIVFGKKKTIVLDEMTQMGYKQKYHNDLMDIKTYMYTHEAAEELYTLAQNKQQYLDKINETNVIDMWVQDLLKIK